MASALARPAVLRVKSGRSSAVGNTHVRRHVFFAKVIRLDANEIHQCRMVGEDMKNEQTNSYLWYKDYMTFLEELAEEVS